MILSRLTYCVYISHGTIQLYTAGSIREPIYASVFNVVCFVCMLIWNSCYRINFQAYETASDILLAYILAFVLTMLYESPIIAMERVLLKREGIVFLVLILLYCLFRCYSTCFRYKVAEIS